MSTSETPNPPVSQELLKAIAAQQGVAIQEADLEAVMAFLRVLLPQLQEIEAIVEADTVPARLFQPPEVS